MENDNTISRERAEGLRMLGWFKKQEQPARLAQRIAKRIASYGSLEQIERADAPPGETAKMAEIQQLSWLAGVSAETVARAKAEGRLEEDWAQYDLERYKGLRAECIELADTITNEFYRAVVINYLVEVCMKAADVDEARALFRHQAITSLRADIVTRYPELVRPRISEIMNGRAQVDEARSGQSPPFPRDPAITACAHLRPEAP